MAERLRTEGVGRGVNWAGMSNLANIIQRGGETQAELIKGIGETIGRKIRDQQEFSLANERLDQQRALQEQQYQLDLDKFNHDKYVNAQEIENKRRTGHIASLVNLAEQAREANDPQLWQQVTRRITSDLAMEPIDEANAIMGLQSDVMGPLMNEEELASIGPSEATSANIAGFMQQAQSIGGAGPEQIPVLRSAFKSWFESVQNNYNDVTNRTGQIIASNQRWTDGRRQIAREYQRRERESKADFMAAQAASREIDAVLSAAESTARSQTITRMIEDPSISADMRAALTMVKPWVESGAMDVKEGMQLAMRSMSEARMGREAEGKQIERDVRARKRSVPAAAARVGLDARKSFEKVMKDSDLVGVNRSNKSEYDEAVIVAGDSLDANTLIVLSSDPNVAPTTRQIARDALVKSYPQDERVKSIMSSGSQSVYWPAYILLDNPESYGLTREDVEEWLDSQRNQGNADSPQDEEPEDIDEEVNAIRLEREQKKR